MRPSQKLKNSIHGKLRLVHSFLCCMHIVLAGVLIMPHASNAAGTPQQDHAPQEVGRLHAPAYLNSVAWNSDGTRLAGLSNYGQTITVWQTNPWKKLNEFQNPGTSYMFNSLSFLADGSLLTTPKVVFGKEHLCTFVQWNVSNGKRVREIPDVCYPDRKDDVGGLANTYTVSKDGSLIAGIGGKVGVMLFDANSGKFIKALKVPPTPNNPDDAWSVTFSPDGHTLAVGTLFGYLHFYDVQSGSIVRSINIYDNEACNISSLAFSPDGAFIAAGKAKGHDIPNPKDRAVTILRVKDGEFISSLSGSIITRHDGKNEDVNVRTISWSPTDDVLAVGDDLSLRFWHVADPINPRLLMDKKIARGSYKTAFSTQGMLAATDNDEIIIYQPHP
jgi:WD40 repeat protein